AAKYGLQSGDEITAINGEEMSTWEGIRENVLYTQFEDDLTVDVQRDGEALTIEIPRKAIENISVDEIGISPEGAQTFIGGVEPGLPASRAGLKESDIFVNIDDDPIYMPTDVITSVSRNPEKPIKIVWERDGKTMQSMITPTANGKIGVIPISRIPGPVTTVHYGVFEALVVGVKGLVRVTDVFLTNIWHIIIGEASFKQSIGGPVKIAEMAAQSAEAGIFSFLSLMALLSISLAIINIFPIPALDGGHLVFLIFEGLFRREVPNKIKIAMQQAGMVLLLALMIFVIYNDIF
ncbi:MAG: RIP metalloprotease RseP, partial [Ignavibacteria bacterium]